jgi:hypothetical protein
MPVRRGATMIGAMLVETRITRQRPPTRERPPLPSWELYQAWQAAFEEAGEALADWRVAPVMRRADAYAAYRAAADREDAAAASWLVA